MALPQSPWWALLKKLLLPSWSTKKQGSPSSSCLGGRIAGMVYFAARNAAAGAGEGACGLRIMLSSDHEYPAFNGVSFGPHPKEFSSGSGHHLQDLLARGLSEAGHEVLYYLPRGAERSLASGNSVDLRPDTSVDVYQNMAFRYEELIRHMEDQCVPWVTDTTSSAAHARKRAGTSRATGFSYRKRQRIAKGADVLYLTKSIPKILFIPQPSRIIFYSLVRWSGRGTKDSIWLWPLQSAPDAACGGRYCRRLSTYQQNSRGLPGSWGALLGGRTRFGEGRAIRGRGRSAVSTKLDEAFGLVIIEALMSGTPVICSGNGACPEIVTPDVGFVCHDLDEYVEAAGRLHEIRPEACRKLAMEQYHYRRMAADYIKEYEAEIAFMDQTR